MLLEWQIQEGGMPAHQLWTSFHFLHYTFRAREPWYRHWHPSSNILLQGLGVRCETGLFSIHVSDCCISIESWEIFEFEIIGEKDIIDQSCGLGTRFLAVSCQLPRHKPPYQHICPWPGRWFRSNVRALCRTAITGRFAEFASWNAMLWIIWGSMSVFTGYSKSIEASEKWVENMQDYSG